MNMITLINNITCDTVSSKPKSHNIDIQRKNRITPYNGQIFIFSNVKQTDNFSDCLYYPSIEKFAEIIVDAFKIHKG